MISRIQAAQVTELVYSVGEYIRNERITFQSSAIEHKDIHDMVSYVDKTSEKKLIEGIKKIIPQSSFLAEESEMNVNQSKYHWIIDPLDGTTNFIHHIPMYCISIGLQFEGKLIAGWVYEICNDEMFTAVKGEGAYLNRKKIEVSKTTDLHQSLILTGFPVREFKGIQEQMKLLQIMIENTRGIRRLGTAAYDLCLVACGRAEAYYELGLSPWDVAAGAIIVQEAGGMVTDFKEGNKFIENAEILATNSYIHSSVFNHIHQCIH